MRTARRVCPQLAALRWHRLHAGRVLGRAGGVPPIARARDFAPLTGPHISGHRRRQRQRRQTGNEVGQAIREALRLRLLQPLGQVGQRLLAFAGQRAQAGHISLQRLHAPGFAQDVQRIGIDGKP